jgi:hypothetical protein
MVEQHDEFDPEKAVATYREVIAHLKTQSAEPGKQEFRGIAIRLRKQWKDWQGEDSLHEMAFVETGE